jgi:hypothetical protein
MKKRILSQITLIVFLAATIDQINADTQSYDFNRAMPIGMFGFLKFQAFLNTQKAKTLYQKLQKEKQMKEQIRNDELKLSLEKERVKLFQLYLVSPHNGTSFLRDFHTRRF